MDYERSILGKQKIANCLIISSNMYVHQIKDREDLQNQLRAAGQKLVVIDFFATWCGPCKMIAPIVEEIAKNTPDVVFLKVDSNQCEDLLGDYNISGLPTFVFIKGQKEVGSFVGANEHKLKEFINRLK